ncbi:MAG: protein kinase domain-containing protein, partial [Acidimicrobiales bacterium]
MAPSRIVEHVGRVLGDRYRLTRPLGTGASAHVYVAEDVTLRRRVAVKLLHPALAGDEAFLRRFRAEAQVVAALRHSNIVRVYDWGEADGSPYLVMELLEGGSLRSLLDRGQLLSPSQAAKVGADVARALDYAHRRGLVHRDVKPANLLFDDEGQVSVADFGLARALAEASWTEPAGAVLGTARYAAPEQISGGGLLDGKADVYSLALVLVEAVTGTVPFAADTTIGTLMGRVNKDLPVPQELGPLVQA